MSQTGKKQKVYLKLFHMQLYLLIPEGEKFLNITNYIFHFCYEGIFFNKGLFICVKITALPQSDVYLAASHLPAPIILSCVPLSSWVSLYILLLLLISFPMTRLSEEAVVLCFQLTLRHISEPWSARLGCLLLLSLSAALASSLSRVLFKHSGIPCWFHGIIQPNSQAFYSRRMFYLNGSNGVLVLTSGTCTVLSFGRHSLYLLLF